MSQQLTQQEIAIQDGYTKCFVFADGHIYCTTNPSVSYCLKEVEKQPYPCILTETVVYRITTPDGVKGIAVIEFEQDEHY